MAPVSIGDCIALAELAKNITKAVRDSGGAADEYQSLVDDLEFLSSTFSQIKSDAPKLVHLHPAQHAHLVEFLKKSQSTLDRLAERTNKFAGTLGRKAKKRTFAGPARKVQWGVEYSEDVSKFRNVVNSEVASLNLFLQSCTRDSIHKIHDEVGLLKRDQEIRFQILESRLTNLQISTERHCEDKAVKAQYIDTNDMLTGDDQLAWARTHEQIAQQGEDIIPLLRARRNPAVQQFDQVLQDTTKDAHAYLDALRRLLDAAKASPVAANDTGSTNFRWTEAAPRDQDSSKTSALYLKSASEIGVLLQQCAIASLIRVIRGAWMNFRQYGIAIFHMYAMMRQTMSPTRQPLLLVEDSIQFIDALGRIKNFQYDSFQHWQVFESALICNFTNMPGEYKVQLREYVLEDAKTNRPFTLRQWNKSVFPGSKIQMAMTIKTEPNNGLCPRPDCSDEVSTGKDGHIRCPKCELIFSQGNIEMESTLSDDSDDYRRKPTTNLSDSEKRIRELREISIFRRIHLLVDHQSSRLYTSSSSYGGGGGGGGGWGGAYYCCECGYGPMLYELHPACVMCSATACSKCQPADMTY